MNEAAPRFEAARLLQALAGREARLREDQWTAISALVADRHRVLVVQRRPARMNQQNWRL